MNKLRSKLHLALMTVVLLITMGGLAGCGIGTPGTGVKIGQIVKLSRQGMICKTWEGQLLRGGLTDGSGAIGAPFEFTIENEGLVPDLQTALENQTEVKISYTTEGLYSACRTDSGGVFLDSVQTAPKRSPPAIQPY